MKLTLSLCLLAFFATAQTTPETPKTPQTPPAVEIKPDPAQPTLVYELKMIKPDSFFIDEIFTQGATKDAPWPTSTVTHIFFRDTVQMKAYIEGLVKEANDANQQKMKYEQLSGVLIYKAREIEKIRTTSEWFTTKPKTAPPAEKPKK